MTMSESDNWQWALSNIVVRELKVVLDSAGVFYDEVRWISKKLLMPKDTTAQKVVAGLVKPYRIPLDVRGKS